MNEDRVRRCSLVHSPTKLGSVEVSNESAGRGTDVCFQSRTRRSSSHHVDVAESGTRIRAATTAATPKTVMVSTIAGFRRNRIQIVQRTAQLRGTAAPECDAVPEAYRAAVPAAVPGSALAVPFSCNSTPCLAAAATMRAIIASVMKGGAAERSCTGSKASFIKFSKPAGEKTTSIRATVSPSLRNACTVPSGMCAKSPFDARSVRRPTVRETVPSST